MSVVATIGTIVGVSLPIVVWGYIFSYYGGAKFAANKFFLGLFAGSMAVLPILYAPDIFGILGMQHFIEVLGSNTSGSLSESLDIVGSFFLSTILPVGAFLLVIGALHFQNIKEYYKRVVVSLLLGVTFLGIVVFGLSMIGVVGSGEVRVHGNVVRGFAAIAAFYVFVAGLEEMMKYFGLFSSNGIRSTSKKEVLLVGVYTALGFVFFENILYLLGAYNASGFGSTYFGLLASRSIVSLLLHVFATLILTVGFYYWMQNSISFGGIRRFFEKSSLQFFRYFLLAIFAHGLFNFSLTYNVSWILPVYAIVGYFFLTNIFYSEEEDSSFGPNYTIGI